MNSISDFLLFGFIALMFIGLLILLILPFISKPIAFKIPGAFVKYGWPFFRSFVIYGGLAYSLGQMIVSRLKLGGTVWASLAEIMPFLVAGYLAWQNATSGVSKKLLVKKLESAELESHQEVFPPRQVEWENFKSQIKPQDEVWSWRTPDWTWKMLVGREGLTIVRKGKPTRHIFLRGMN